MKPKIDFGECLKDSPRFRASLEQSEQSICELEGKLDKLIKYSNGMVDAGKVYTASIGNFVTGIKDITNHFKEDDLVKNSADKFVNALSEMQNYHSMLFDQTHRAICKALSGFVKEDIKKVKETKKVFDRITDDLESAYAKHAQVNRTKPGEAEEAYNVLSATRSAYAHTALDYVCQISIVDSRKKYEILNSLLSFTQAQYTFNHQGYDLLKELEPFFKQLSSQLAEQRVTAIAEKKEMDKRHNLVNDVEMILSQVPADKPAYEMEGYLFKRASNAFKTWNRRWFIIQNNQLIYQKKLKDTPTVVADLNLCTVKLANEIERRFCFEVVSPTKTCMLQADSENLRKGWIEALEAAINRSFSDHGNTLEKTANDESSSSSSVEASIERGSNATKSEPSLLTKLQSIPGNDKCCDCQTPNPRWASINLGITLCIECSGTHRSFGVQTSKVRSLTLDAWEPETRKVMAELGNDKINKIYEASVDETIAKRAMPMCDRDVREAWIRAKYVDKKFVKKLPTLPSHVSKPDGRGLVKQWSVTKHHRRKSKKATSKIDGGEETTTDIQTKLVPSSGNASPASLRTGVSSDSGLGGSADVLVFGSCLERNDIMGEGIKKHVEDIDQFADYRSSDEESIDETMVTNDATTTSLEDLAKLHPNMLLYKAAGANNLPVMLEALANGAEVNWINTEDHRKCPLHQAVFGGSLAACDFLLLNGAKVNTRDGNGKGVLHHATILGHTGLVCLFLKRGANQHAVDADGQDALKIALTTANADIVTLLRLARLHEDMRESEGIFSNSGDETFQDVFKDFTEMASNAPEKLNRQSMYDKS
ncbi:arf-GAP with coiled-coil, ANK repeat and PH domain-containing protein 2-like [Saccoglossus kowalevskii]|uniref:Arf-GAP with coiled-coil, ANK repeat and PH domain-containing protein 2-like n=1 Tax=Saccoglossus kowalevskii TaxID=10224 RepID=A0ABM0MI77_SACKO|nr:PREDICTED: arf-GAP with coiled-coil, ANK repeat and PH domain-containing protein 2-like [Saccoglossus kowalevskii]